MLKNGDPCPYDTAPTEFNDCYKDAWDSQYWNTVCKYKTMPPSTFDPAKDKHSTERAADDKSFAK